MIIVLRISKYTLTFAKGCETRRWGDIIQESMEEFEFEDAVLELIVVNTRTGLLRGMKPNIHLEFLVKPRDWHPLGDIIMTADCHHQDFAKEARKAYDLWKDNQ